MKPASESITFDFIDEHSVSFAALSFCCTDSGGSRGGALGARIITFHFII